MEIENPIHLFDHTEIIFFVLVSWNTLSESWVIVWNLVSLILFSVEIVCDVITGDLKVTSNGGNGQKGQDGGKGGKGRDNGDDVRGIFVFANQLTVTSQM